MFDRVVDNGLQHEIRHLAREQRARNVHDHLERLAKSQALEVEVLLSEFELVAEGHQHPVGRAQHTAKAIAQPGNRSHGGVVLLVSHQAGNGVERVEQEVRFDLLLKGVRRTDLQPGVIAALKDFAALLQPVKYEKSDVRRKVTGIETIGDRSYYLVESHPGRLRPTGPANSYPDAVERLFFDVQTGLLYKDQVTIETPLGTKVEETSFEDYRDVDGLKLPYLIITHYMEDENLFKISEIDANIDVAPAKFEPADPKARKDGSR